MTGRCFDYCIRDSWMQADEAERQYNEAKMEAKRMVRKAKNEDRMCLGRELEKDACGNQRRF